MTNTPKPEALASLVNELMFPANWRARKVGIASDLYDSDAPFRAATTITTLAAERDALKAALRGLYDDMTCLINDSTGVNGLHLNGDPADWDELLTGGRFEDWLGPAMDNARTTLERTAQP